MFGIISIPLVELMFKRLKQLIGRYNRANDTETKLFLYRRLAHDDKFGGICFRRFEDIDTMQECNEKGSLRASFSRS